jgi:hypothetical protein
MGVQIYKNGAWATPTLKIYKNGAWVNVSSMKRYINGEWLELLKGAPVGKLVEEYVSFVDTSTSYTYDITNDGVTINCKISNAVGGNNNVPFRITRVGGFGKTIKLKYTITQTMTSQAYASTRWLKMDYSGMSTTSDMWYNYYSRSNETFEGTLTFDTDQTYIYLLFEAYSGNLNSTISNVYINDELVTFT